MNLCKKHFSGTAGLFFRSIIAVFIIITMLAEYGSGLASVKAKNISIDEYYLEEGMMNILNMEDNKANLVPGLLYKKDEEKKLYITFNTAASLAKLLLLGGGDEYRFVDGCSLCIYVKSNGDVTAMGKSLGTVDTFVYKDKLYADMEQILAVLGVQFAEENDRMVYLPRQKTIIDYVDTYFDDLKSIGVSQSELNINHGTYGTAFRAGLSLVLNNFSVKIFIPFINDDLYEKESYEDALLQLAVSDEAFMTDDMLGRIDTLTQSDDIGNLIDVMNYASKANDILQLPTAFKDWQEIEKYLKSLQEQYKSTKFSKSFELDAKAVSGLDNFSYAFGLFSDAYSMFNIYAEASDIQTRSENWSNECVNQYKFLSALGSNSYGDEGEMVKSVAGKLVKEHDFPTGAALASYGEELSVFALGKLADMSPIGPIITATNAGVAMLQSDPSIKAAMESYENMYSVRNLIQVQNIAYTEMQKKYEQLRMKAIDGTLTQKDIDEFRIIVNLLIKCSLRNCSLTLKLYEELAEGDWSGEKASLENRICRSAGLLNRLENTALWDYEELKIVKAENYYSDDYGFVRQPITENVWVAGSSDNNGTNYVYSDGYTYFWKNTADGYDSEYVWGNYMPRKCSDSQLVRVDEAGAVEVLYTGDGYGNLGVSGEWIYYNNSDGVFGINIANLEIKGFGAGEIKCGDDDSGFLICGDYDSIFSINMATAEKYILNSRYNNSMVYSDGIAYIAESDSTSIISIYAGSIDGSVMDVIATYTMDDIFGAGASNSGEYSMCGMSVSAMQVMGNYLYYNVGARGGTGSIWQGGNIYRVTLDTFEVELLVGNHEADDNFRVAYGNDGDPVREKLYYTGGYYFDTKYVMNLETRQSEETNTKVKCADEIFGDGLDLYIYRGNSDDMTCLVSGGDYDNHGSANLGAYEKILVQIKDAQVCGKYIYFNVWYSTEYDAVSIGWRTGYKRESTTIYRKNTNTGEVTVVHAF